jgi:hypothetical protein
MNIRDAVFDTIEETVGGALWPYNTRLVHEAILDSMTPEGGWPAPRVLNFIVASALWGEVSGFGFVGGGER